MIVVEANSKENLTSNTKFSKELLFKEVFRSSKDLPEVKTCLVMVHGFWGIYNTIKSSYKDIESRLIKSGVKYDLVVEFYWPSSEITINSTLGFIDAEKRAPEAGWYLHNCLLQINDKYHPEEIVVQGHSLGSRVICEVQPRIDPVRDIKLPEFSVVFCAPAISNSKFLGTTRNMKIPLLIPFSKRPIKIAYSKKDPVLKWGFRLIPENWFSSAIGSSPSKKLLAYPGIHCFDLSQEVSTHSGYKYLPKYYKEILCPY